MHMAEQGKMVYEGKAKRIYETSDGELVIQEFKDDTTAFNAKKKGTIENKGVYNNKISAKLFELLESKGIATHFVKLVDDRRMLVKSLKIIPIEVTIRNVVAGGMAERFGLEEGIVLKRPVLEYHYKSDELGDPLINDSHILALDLTSESHLRVIRERSLEINNVLKTFFAERGLDLIDFKLEFGISKKGKILLGDEISPDTCRFWEQQTKRKLDKDRFRRDLGDVEAAYQEILKRIT